MSGWGGRRMRRCSGERLRTTGHWHRSRGSLRRICAGTQVGTPYYGIYAPGTARPHWVRRAAWSDAGVIIPWTSWMQTGDTSVIDENWQAMRKYVDAIDARESRWDLA